MTLGLGSLLFLGGLCLCLWKDPGKFNCPKWYCCYVDSQVVHSSSSETTSAWSDPHFSITVLYYSLLDFIWPFTWP
jgi:hypothetical protein